MEFFFIDAFVILQRPDSAKSIRWEVPVLHYFMHTPKLLQEMRKLQMMAIAGFELTCRKAKMML